MLAALTSAALLAHPAHALSDLVPYTPAGWSAPVPVRATADATGASALDSAQLFGDTNSFLSRAVRNNGTTTVLVAPTNQILVDGVVQHSAVSSLLPPGITTFVVNVPVTVSGGLHAVGALADATNAEAESNETNNEFARQLSFTPVALPLHTIATRSAPPLKRAGTTSVAGTVYDNQDGLRLPANEFAWEAVALRPPAGQDYDLSFYDASTAPGNGFRTPLKASALGSGATDFVINNGNFVGAPPHDIGVTNFSGSAVDYTVEHRQSNGTILNSGNTYPGLTLALNQMLAIHTFQHVPNVSVPRVLIEVTGTPGTVLHVALFDASATYASRNEALADAAMNASGRGYLDLALPTTGSVRQYGLVVYRDQSDGGTAATSYTLRIRPTPADLSNRQAPGLTTPINAGHGSANWTTVPTTLQGETATTLSYYFTNSGAQPSPTFQFLLRRDGAQLNQISFTAVAPDALRQSFAFIAPVPGGRHTLSYVLDSLNGIDETNEDDNSYGRQFVWSPLQLTDGVPITRAMPPEPQGGWGEIPNSVSKFPNCDGLRSPVLTGSTIKVLATAVLPGGDSDVDLSAFAPSTGPLNGFATPLTSSVQVAHRTDMIAISNFGSYPSNDFGVTKFAGPDDDYTLESTSSDEGGPLTGDLGVSSIAPGHLVKPFTFNPGSVGGPFYVVLENLSGDADLGLSIFAYELPPNDVRSMEQTLPGGLADANGPGASEVATISPTAPFGYYAAVVWKKGSADLPKDATFRVRVNPATTGVTPPAPSVTSFALANGNPLRTHSTLRYELPADASVSLDVLDLQGRLVRSLESGMRGKGVHTADWDGTDASGLRVANGAYFVRFASNGYQRVLKLAVLR